MFTELYWIDGPWPGRLAISARPRGGDWLEEEMHAWRRAGLDTVVSLLTPDEVEDLGLQQERDVCRKNGIEFLSLPIVDRGIPALDGDTVELFEHIEEALVQGKNVDLHCRQGVGRAGLVAASLLVARGTPPAVAVDQVGKARHVTVPETPEQRAWIDSFAATLTPAVAAGKMVTGNEVSAR
jgi:protein-tyrosine phosphatase